MKTFNSPLESGLKTLLVLDAIGVPASLDRLVSYDYLLVHSGDLEGPESVHPPIPMRAGELVVRRDLVRQGLEFYMAKGLAMAWYEPSGLSYSKTKATTRFLEYLKSDYFWALRVRATWIADTIHPLSDAQLTPRMEDIISDNGDDLALLLLEDR